MKNYILSIIVPSYNISKYVDEVLPTYISDSLFDKVKILLIDDGATDDTKIKVSKYVKNYPELFYFYHKENGGHGSVINYAIREIVDTKYFKVIDGDDSVYPDALTDLVSYLYETDDDMVISDCSYEYKDHQTISYGIRKDSGKLNLRIHNVTFKTEIFKKHNILVREKVFYEDSQYVLYPLEHITRYSYIPGVVARYRQDDPNQSVNPEVQLRRKAQYELVLMDLLEHYKEIEKNAGIAEKLKVFIVDSIVRIMFGSFEINWSYSRQLKDAINDCRRIDKLYKRYPFIYNKMVKKYKRFRQMRILNFNGIRFARLVHKKRT